MSEISFIRCNPACIQLTEKENYYKIKYYGKHKFLNLIVYLPHIERTVDHEHQNLTITIIDPETSKMIQAIDAHFNEMLPNYRHFSRNEGGQITISFSLNQFVTEFHKKQKTSAHLRFKCIRKITYNNNQALLYIA